MATQVLQGRSRAPGSRDREIYRKISGGLCSQGQAAQEYGISQPRVFQIVKRVEEWIARFVSRRARNTRPPQEQLNIARSMYLYAVDTLWRESMAKWHESQQDVVKHREWEQDGKRFTVTTIRPGRGKVKYLRLACRCTEELARMRGLEEENDARPVRRKGVSQAEHAEAKPGLTINSTPQKPAEKQPTLRRTAEPPSVLKQAAALACSESELGKKSQQLVQNDTYGYLSLATGCEISWDVTHFSSAWGKYSCPPNLSAWALELAA